MVSCLYGTSEKRKLNKPDGYVETNHLMEMIDRTKESNYIYGSFRELYGICHNQIIIDDRTGQIIKIGSKEYNELD